MEMYLQEYIIPPEKGWDHAEYIKNIILFKVIVLPFIVCFCIICRKDHYTGGRQD